MLDFNRDVAEAVARAFGLGKILSTPCLVETGWADHNSLWRFDTRVGSWAVKQLGREPDAQIENAATIEAAAHAAGVPCPPPVQTIGGTWTLGLEGRRFRCHGWVDGVTPTDDLSQEDAFAAGGAIGHLHTLDLPCDPPDPSLNVRGEAHWRTHIDRSAGLGLEWADHLARALPQILAVEDEARLWHTRPHRWVASHRDVRPDNTLRTTDQVVLVDWDAAGAVVAGREVATALRWWAPHQAHFIRGYASMAGDVDLSEGNGEDGSLLGWLELNVRLAIEEPHLVVRQAAVAALLDDLFPVRVPARRSGPEARSGADGEAVAHAVKIVETTWGSARWKCSCGASAGGQWSRSATEALKKAERHRRKYDN
jgi:Ser/Thr protein kinase RdoA (MazF antagonist)